MNTNFILYPTLQRKIPAIVFLCHPEGVFLALGEGFTPRGL